MLTRIRIETYNGDLRDVEAELDQIELALLRHEFEAHGGPEKLDDLIDEGVADGWDAAMDAKARGETPDHSVEPDPLAGQPLQQMVRTFGEVFGPALTRDLTEQVIEKVEEGNGYRARRVVRYGFFDE
jgi:hypothetical protein